MHPRVHQHLLFLLPICPELCTAQAIFKPLLCHLIHDLHPEIHAKPQLWFCTDYYRSRSRPTCLWVPMSFRNSSNKANRFSRPTPHAPTPPGTRDLLFKQSARRNRRSQRLPHPAPLQGPVQRRPGRSISDQLWCQIRAWEDIQAAALAYGQG